MYILCNHSYDPWFIYFLYLDSTSRRRHTVTAINRFRPVSKSSYRHTGYKTGILQFPTSSNITGMLYMICISSLFIPWCQALKECADEIDLGTQYHLTRYAFLFESIVLSDGSTLVPPNEEGIVINAAFSKCPDQVNNDNRTWIEGYYRKDRQPWRFQDIYAKLCDRTGFSTTSRSTSRGTF